MNDYVFGLNNEQRFQLLRPGVLPEVDVKDSVARESDPDKIEEAHEENSWSNCFGDSFRVRIGPDYHIHGKKAPSNEALYEVCAVDIYRSSSKIDHFGRFVDLDDLENRYQERLRRRQKKNAEENKSFDASPSPSNGPDLNNSSDLSNHDSNSNSEAEPKKKEKSSRDKIPPWFLVNFMIPDYAPSMVWKKEDGDGYNLVVFARLSENSQEKLESEDPGPSLRLLRRFILRNPHQDDEEFDPENPIIRKKFKVIARAMNTEYSNFNSLTRSMVHQYNAKPFLCRTSSSFFSGPNYFETDVDVHRFGYPARLGLAGVRQSVISVIFDFAFVVQSEDNDEMPEQILACSRMSKIDPHDSLHFPKEIFNLLDEL